LRTIKGMDDRTPSKVEGAIERLNQDPYLLAAITAVPFVGGSITQALTGIGQQIVQERNARLFEQLSEHLATVDEQAIKQGYFETPEGFDLLIKAMDESRRTRSDDKRDLIARILRGALIDGESKYSPEEYLNLISDLTPQELMVLRSAYRQRPGPGMDFRMWCHSAARQAGFDRRDLFMTLSRLEAHGLIQVVEKAAGTRRSGSRTIVREHKGLDRIERIFVSPPFQKLMRFLDMDEKGRYDKPGSTIMVDDNVEKSETLP
jgi:hypothetical protein